MIVLIVHKLFATSCLITLREKVLCLAITDLDFSLQTRAKNDDNISVLVLSICQPSGKPFLLVLHMLKYQNKKISENKYGFNV